MLAHLKMYRERKWKQVTQRRRWEVKTSSVKHKRAAWAHERRALRKIAISPENWMKLFFFPAEIFHPEEFSRCVLWGFETSVMSAEHKHFDMQTSHYQHLPVPTTSKQGRSRKLNLSPSSENQKMKWGRFFVHKFSVSHIEFIFVLICDFPFHYLFCHFGTERGRGKKQPEQRWFADLKLQIQILSRLQSSTTVQHRWTYVAQNEKLFNMHLKTDQGIVSLFRNGKLQITKLNMILSPS